MRVERRLEIAPFRMPRQSIEKERHGDQHALREIADGGHEDRPFDEPAVDHDLGQMLMREIQSIEFEGWRAMLLIGGDHRLAAAGVAGDGIDRDLVIGRQNAGVGQGPQQRDRARRVTAGIGDALCARDRLRLLRC